MAEFVTLAELDDPKAIGRFTALAVVFGGMNPEAEIRVVKNDKQGHDKWPDYRVKVKVNGSTCDLGVLWRSDKGKTFAAGKLDAGVSALRSWPADTSLLLQEAKDDYPWRLTAVFETAAEAAKPVNGGATDGSDDFGNGDDPFAEE